MCSQGTATAQSSLPYVFGPCSSGLCGNTFLSFTTRRVAPTLVWMAKLMIDMCHPAVGPQASFSSVSWSLSSAPLVSLTYLEVLNPELKSIYLSHAGVILGSVNSPLAWNTHCKIGLMDRVKQGNNQGKRVQTSVNGQFLSPPLSLLSLPSSPIHCL